MKFSWFFSFFFFFPFFPVENVQAIISKKFVSRINTKTLCHFVKRHAINLEMSLRALQTELPLLRVDTRFGNEKKLAEQ